MRHMFHRGRQTREDKKLRLAEKEKPRSGDATKLGRTFSLKNDFNS